MVNLPTESEPVVVVEGDSLTVLRELPDGCVDAVVTDPPFKLSQEYGTGADADNLLAVSMVWPVAAEMLRVCKPGGLCAMFYDTRILPLALAAMQHAGWKYLRAVTLYRRWGQASLVHGWMTTSDFVLVFAAPGAKPAFHGKPAHDVYTKAAPEADTTGHPAQKPLDAVRHIVANVTPEGGCVLDPFAGSGTTGKAAQIEGRRCLLIEREPAYTAIARRRVAEALGAGSLFAQGTPAPPHRDDP